MVFRVGDDPIKVRWYFVDCDHNNMPLWTPFASANWVSRVSEAGQLGEQPGPRTWVNGAPPANAGNGDEVGVLCVTEHEDWWTNGIGAGEETGPYLPSGLPVCCEEVVCCTCEIPDVITIEIEAEALCCLEVGEFINLTREGPTSCIWRSGEISCDGHMVEVGLDIEATDDCSAQGWIRCDGVEYGRDGAGGQLCDGEDGSCILVPLFNDCCNFVQFSFPGFA